MATILENVQGVKARLAHAARAAGRNPESVTLLAVSKTHPVARIAEAQAAGLAPGVIAESMRSIATQLTAEKLKKA